MQWYSLRVASGYAIGLWCTGLLLNCPKVSACEIALLMCSSPEESTLLGLMRAELIVMCI